jgi:hypothetical protein
MEFTLYKLSGTRKHAHALQQKKNNISRNVACPKDDLHNPILSLPIHFNL